jgi:hypothetical protein
MYIKKNMFKNTFNTMIDLKGKKKDTMKAKMNIPLFCQCKNMKLIYDGPRVAKPKASFILEK